MALVLMRRRKSSLLKLEYYFTRSFTFLGDLIQLNYRFLDRKFIPLIFLLTVSLASGQGSLFLPRLLFSTCGNYRCTSLAVNPRVESNDVKLHLHMSYFSINIIVFYQKISSLIQQQLKYTSLLQVKQL